MVAASKHKKNPNTKKEEKEHRLAEQRQQKFKDCRLYQNQNIEWHAPLAVSGATKRWEVEIWKRSTQFMNLSSSCKALCGIGSVLGNGAKMCV